LQPRAGSVIPTVPATRGILLWVVLMPLLRLKVSATGARRLQGSACHLKDWFTVESSRPAD
jgi:hypothetical protein